MLMMEVVAARGESDMLWHLTSRIKVCYIENLY